MPLGYHEQYRRPVYYDSQWEQKWQVGVSAGKSDSGALTTFYRLACLW